MYGICATALGREKVEVPLREDLDLNLEALLRAVEENGPSLAFFSYPNNPTGNCFKEDAIKRVRQEGVFTVIDEAYYHFSGKTFLTDALQREDTVGLKNPFQDRLSGLESGRADSKGGNSQRNKQAEASFQHNLSFSGNSQAYVGRTFTL
jgi:histidinol-phosphate aminotransferase